MLVPALISNSIDTNISTIQHLKKNRHYVMKSQCSVSVLYRSFRVNTTKLFHKKVGRLDRFALFLSTFEFHSQ